MVDTSRNPYDLRRVPNCDTLTMYRIKRSRFWQCRWQERHPNRTRHISTRLESYRDAVMFAKDAWLASLVAHDPAIPVNQSIKYWIKSLQADQDNQVARGQRNPRFAKVDNPRLALIGEFFHGDRVDRIDGARIKDFETHLYDRNPSMSRATVHQYFVTLRKVLKQAAMSGAIQSLPVFPSAGGTTGINPRTGFTRAEYKRLRDHLKGKIHDDPRAADVYDMVLFLTNSLLRPSEAKLLRHDHVRIGKDAAGETLMIRPPNPKVRGRDYETFAMPGAVQAYKRLMERHPGANSSLFFPDIDNRDYALRVLGELFGEALEALGMKTTRDGKRTLYSLRHSGISWRLESGAPVFDVARWARTSVAMIEKYYASVYQLSRAAPSLRATGKR